MMLPMRDYEISIRASILVRKAESADQAQSFVADILKDRPGEGIFLGNLEVLGTKDLGESQGLLFLDEYE